MGGMYVGILRLLLCSSLAVGPGQDHAHDTIAQLHFMEVDDQPKWDIQELHVAEDLRFVDR